MLQITPFLSIPESEITIDFIRASGPGGQNVNKVATACQLHFNVRASRSLSEEIKQRLVKLAGNKMTLDGVLVIEAKRYRSQERNRSDAELRLTALIQKAMIQPKIRRETRPTTASRERRVEAKKRKGVIKRLRRSSPNE
jgi:ribosome-associated protein